jgi:hypothetical protein
VSKSNRSQSVTEEKQLDVKGSLDIKIKESGRAREDFITSSIDASELFQKMVLYSSITKTQQNPAGHRISASS